MKNKSRKKTIIIAFGMVFAFLSINNYNLFDDQGNNEEMMDFYDETNLKLAAPNNITIITPENKTYFGPMSGYYPATYGFESDADGSYPEGWEEVSTGGSFYVQTISNKFGRNKVLEGYDGGNGAFRINHYFNATEGTIEFWMAHTSMDADKSMSTIIFNSTGSVLFGIALRENNIVIYTNTGQIIVSSYNINTWYHFRFDFRSDSGISYEGLSQNEFKFYFDDVYNGTYGFDTIGDPDYLWCRSTYTSAGSYYSYWDAFGFSWDPDYDIGDNFNEGLLLSFTNTTSLDWMGYSLDNQANRTIIGNTTIPMQIGGSHTIQVFGNDSFGTIYSSDRRYFTCLFNLTGNPIFIDDSDPNYNWSKTSLENSWCSGSGTWNDPYVIEHVLIDGQNAGNCIEIRNSINNYFIIRNCKVYNAHGGDWAGGIKLSDTNNGTLTNNNCSNNVLRTGIILLACENITISANTVSYNKYGIYLRLSSNNNKIFGNTLNNNDYYGIYLALNCNINTISGNTANNGLVGINLVDCDYNTVSGNFIYENDWYGILIQTGSDGNLLFNNSIYNNDLNNAQDDGNNQWDNGTIGNYWDDYGGVDVNDDGIGDTPYNVPAGGNVDNYPIWDDGPHVIIINSPNPGDVFGAAAPSFNVSIYFPIFDTSWYTLDNGPTNYPFIGSSGTINQTAWDTYGDESVTIRFFANNTAGYFYTTEITVFKDILAPTIDINYPIIYSVFGEFAPAYIISIEEGNLNKTWYTMDGGIINTTFTELAGIINQTLWDALPNGYVTIRLYAIDIAGHIGFKDVIVIKEVPDYLLYVDVVDQIFSKESFNISFYVYNGTNVGIDFATIEIWWNVVEVSTDVQNLGDGFYSISLDPITVAPGEDPILLDMIISADGYEDLYYETYLAVDPIVIQKYDEDYGVPITPMWMVFLMGLLYFGMPAGLIILVIYLNKRRKRAPI